MDKEYFLRLLRKYPTGELTAEEQRLLEKYYDLFSGDADVLQSLNAEQKEELLRSAESEVWSLVADSGYRDSRVIRLSRKWMAAAAVFLLVGAGLIWFLVDGTPAKRPVASTGPAVQPSRENRILFLPDGSMVTLSPGSHLDYPSSFDDRAAREVFLQGQAFFDIKHNVSRLFIVHTGKLSTTVLGTSFNIKAMPGDSNITVTVKQGKVRVSDDTKVVAIINPNEQITYNNRSQIGAQLKIVSVDSCLRWKDRDLFVDNVTLSEAARLLEEQYHAKIAIGDASISARRFTATFARNQSFENILKSICLFNDLSYQYDKKTQKVMITANK